MKKVADLTRQEKIELIRRLQAREVNVIDGMIVELSPVIIIKNGKYLMGDQEFDHIEQINGLFSEGQTLIILPHNNRDKTTEE